MRLINKSECECYNESLSHPCNQALNSSDLDYLESEEDEDGQLMIYLPFKCPVKLTSLQLIGPDDGEEIMNCPLTSNIMKMSQT